MPAHNYRPFIGLPYQPPYGCLHLVQQVFRDCYGADLDHLTLGDNASIRAMHELLMRETEHVDTPREGDIAWIKANPWHVGVVIDPPLMIHSYSGGGHGSSICESYEAHDVHGFYRYKGFL